MSVNLDNMVTLQAAWSFVAPDQGSASFSAVTSTTFQNLTTFRQIAHDEIKDYLGYEFLTNSYTLEPYNGSGMKRLLLNNEPVTAVNAVQYNGTALSADVFSSIVIIDRKYLFFSNRFWSRGEYIWGVSYTAGWPVIDTDGSSVIEAVPGRIVGAALKLIALYYGYPITGGTHVGRLSYTEPGGGMVSYDPDAVQKILSECFEQKRIGL